jgi:HD superfamily phosphohydrolase
MTPDLCSVTHTCLKNFTSQEYFGKFTAEKILASKARIAEPHISQLLEHLKKYGSSVEFSYTDPIHGRRQLPEWMLGIINTPPLLRLAQVGQISLLPHSRLAHSIGVAILALDTASYHKLDEDHKRLLVSLALMHDVRHGPYSHLFDNLYIENKERFFNHDARLHEFLDQPDLQSALENSGVDKKRVIKALKDPESDNDGYIVKVIFDRVDYAMRDTHYSNKIFSDIQKDSFKNSAMGLFSCIEFDPIDKSFYFSDTPESESAIEKFVEMRQEAFTRLAFNERRRLAQSLVYSEIKEMLGKERDSQSAGKLVEALSHLCDPDLERRLAQHSAKALGKLKQTEQIYFVRIEGDELTDDFKQLRGRKNGGLGATTTILNALKDINPKLTILVSIIPMGSPKMNFKIKGSDGSYKFITGSNDSYSAQETQCIAISGYYRDGSLLSENHYFDSTVRDIFSKKGWIREPAATYSSNFFREAEMPSGAEDEYRKLFYNPRSG